MPDVLVQSHSASLCMTFYTGEQFPPEYRLDAFAAEHGSWNRARRTGYKVIRVPLKDGKATGEYEDFLVGFVTPGRQRLGPPGGRHRGQGRSPPGHRRRLGNRVARRLHRVQFRTSPMSKRSPDDRSGLIFALRRSQPACRSWPRLTLAGSASGSCRRHAISPCVVNGEAGRAERQGIDFYRVEQADGPSLLLKAGKPGSSGWAASDEVVLVDQAIDFFIAARCEPDPGDAFLPRRAGVALVRQERL